MRTAILGLLALTAVVAANVVITTPTVQAQTIDSSESYEQSPPEAATTDLIAPESGDEAVASDSPEESAPEEHIDLGTFMTTSYSLRGVMRGGDWTYYGAVAVDPRVIPLGSTIYIEDLGYFVAEDTGGAVRGDHIDIWLPSRGEALSYGVQYRRAWLVG